MSNYIHQLKERLLNQDPDAYFLLFLIIFLPVFLYLFKWICDKTVLKEDDKKESAFEEYLRAYKRDNKDI